MLARLIAQTIHNVREELRKLDPPQPPEQPAEPDTHRYDPASVTTIDSQRAAAWDFDKRPPVTAARFGFSPPPSSGRG